MNELERAIAIKTEHSAAIRSRPSVTGIGYGWRRRGGDVTEDPVIRIYVDRKRPPESLSRDEMLPTEIDGIPTDVIELAPGRLQVGPVPDPGRYRPLRAGQRISARGEEGGSIGCFAKTDDAAKRHVLITAQHVVRLARDFTQTQRDGPAMGQPGLCSWCSKCCTSGDEIGDAWFARNDKTIDAAVIELRPGTQWLAEIENGNAPLVMTGVETFAGITNVKQQLNAQQRLVFKRGFMTGLVSALLEDLSFDSTIVTPAGESWEIEDQIAFAQVAMNQPFSESGDSGCPVVTNARKLIGIYFAVTTATAGPNTIALGIACPIKRIQDQFKAACGVGLVIGSDTVAGNVQTAPAAKQALVSNEGPGFELLQHAHEQIRATPRGRELEGVVQQHQHEAIALVRRNKRVAAVWHRNHGPEIVQLALKSIREPDAPIPSSFDGRTFDECARRIADIFRRYGSPALVREIDRCEPEVRRMGGITYRQFLDWLAPIG
jgi:hypothetical protein